MFFRSILAMLFVLTCVTQWLTPIAAAQGATFTDPFAYCAAVGTIDAPDARFAGAKTPETIARGLRAMLGSPDEPLDRYVSASQWRCMGGKVYGCYVGANLPCWAKAETSRTPTADLADYCKANRDGPIPGYASNKASVYVWDCQNGVAVAGREAWQVDTRGFIANIWHILSPRGGTGPGILPAAGITDNTVMLVVLSVGAAMLGVAFRRRGVRRLQSAFDIAQTR